MITINRNSKANELIRLLKDEKTAHSTLESIKKIESFHDEDSQGIKVFLNRNNYVLTELLDFVSFNEKKLEQNFRSKSSRSKIYLPIKIAASLLLILLARFIYTDSRSNKVIPFTKEVGLPVMMGNEQKVAFDNAMNLFRTEEFEKAKVLFEELALVKESDTLLYFIGYSNLELMENKKAISAFSSIPSTSAFYNKSNYYLAISLIQEGNIAQAKEKLILISSSTEHAFKNEAKLLLENNLFAND